MTTPPPNPDPAARRATVAALAIALGTTGLALVLAALHRIGGWGVETDFYMVYLPQARELTDGPPFLSGVVHNPPGFALLVGLAGKLLGDEFRAAKVLSALAAGGFLWLSFRLAARSFDALIGLVTVALLALAILPFSYLAATDLVGAFLITVPIWWLLTRARVGPIQCLLAGVLTGVAYLVRSNAIVLVPVLGLAIVVGYMRDRPWSQRIIGGAMLVAGFVAGISPWLVLNAQYTGSATASTAYLQIAAHFFGSNAGDVYGVTAFPEAAARFKSMGDVLRYDPAHLITRYARDVLLVNPATLLSDIALFPGVLLAGAGIFRLGTRLSLPAVTWLGVCLAGALLLGLVGFYPRYYVFLFPWIFVLVALGAGPAWGPAGAGVAPAWNRWTARLLLTGSVLVLAVTNARAVRTELRSEPRFLLALSDSLHAVARPGDLVVARKPHLAVLSGLRWNFPYVGDAAQLVDAARKEGARFLVYSDFEARIWPALGALKDPSSAPPGLVPRLQDAGSGTIVYELTPAAP